MQIAEQESLKIYEKALAPAFLEFDRAGGTDEAFKAYTAIQAPLWAEHLARIAEEDVVDASSEDDGGGEIRPPAYDKLKKPQLVEILTERQLDTEGTVAVLIERLVADDEVKAISAEAPTLESLLAQLRELGESEFLTEVEAGVEDLDNDEDEAALMAKIAAHLEASPPTD